MLESADAGYHSEANPQYLATRGVPALIADNEMWYPADTAATVAVGLYPAVSVTPRPGFAKGIDLFDAG
ncbi:MAG: hypothetical protein IPP90_11345 [Gemmatimonadaceae bacterium]|nr:hypothetical protein [Gemmatimonadaceae bacterium]